MVCDEKQDMRAETVLGPCVGTERMLLHASNHSLRLYGMDIDGTFCKATLVNGYLWAPWLVRPIPWLARDLAALEQVSQSGYAEKDPTARELSDFMVASAPLHAKAYVNCKHVNGNCRALPLLWLRQSLPFKNCLKL